MSIFIKGMKMPDSCIACKFGREVNYTGDFEEKCLVNDKSGYVSVRKPRLDTCPLVEVKEPHGRLIDIDDAIESYGEMAELGDVSQSKFLNVVIEAEGSEE